MNTIEKKLLEFIDFKEIPSLPEAAKFAITNSISNNMSMNDIAKIIDQNPSLTLKILKIANSAYYSRKNGITNVKDALVLLGYKTIKSIILSITIRNIFKEKNISWFSYRNYWLHLLSTAIISKEISRRQKIGNEDELYAIGLMHDIGKAVFLTSAEKEYKKVIELVLNEHIPFYKAERKIFGFDHTDLASFLLRQWNIPSRLIEPISMHHNYSTSGNVDSIQLTIALANKLSHTFGYITLSNEPPPLDTNELSTKLGLLNSDLEAILSNLNTEIKSYIELLDISPTDIKSFYTIISEANKKLGEMYIENRHIANQAMQKKEVLQHFNDLSYLLLNENNIENILKISSQKLVEAFKLKDCSIAFYIGDKKFLKAHAYNPLNSDNSENYDVDINVVEDIKPLEKNKLKDVFYIKTPDDTVMGFITISTVSNKANKSEIRSFVDYISLILNNYNLQLINRLRSEKLQITVKKLQEEIESRKRSDKLNSLILEHSPYGIIITNNNGDVLLYNKNAEELLSIKLESANLLKNLDNKDSKLIDAIKSSFKVNQSKDIGILRKGKVSYIHLESSILKELSKVIFTIYDITDRKIKEALITEKKKMETLAELAAGIAHNLRSPLAAAKGILELIKNDLEKKEIKILRKIEGKETEDKELIENLNLIASSIEKSFVIINSILALSKKDNKEKIKREIFSLKEAIDEAHLLLKTKFEDKDITFSEILNCNKIKGSKDMFIQILFNLFSNSIEAVEKGGLIKVACYEDKQKIIIDVSDNGKGIPKEDLTRIFEPFYSTSGEAVGRGIGLSITKKMVIAHGGSIKAFLRPEGGTTFRIIIPK